jgi:CubicO group peptidase (beta-lactamase class C family)
MIPGVPFQFGYGFAIGNAATARLGTLPEGAVGWDGSGNTFFWVDPRHKLATVFMTQVMTPKGSPVSLKKIVYQSVYDLPGEEEVRVCN